jgi:sugar (pentulose or hexulose) kinase
MNKNAVAAIFDIGKTNKKLFLFNEQYQIVWEKTARFDEITDEDGFPCEDIHTLTQWVLDAVKEVLTLSEFEIKAINFSAYGASFVYIDKAGKVILPLYNYLKPYPETLKRQFYQQYGGEEKISLETASPVLGSLNSGMQLFRLKHEKPEIYSDIQYCLHFPQYFAWLLSGEAVSEVTSIGCHTNLWNFQTNHYHTWVSDEKIADKLPPLADSDSVSVGKMLGKKYLTGRGLHDSSAALLPYLIHFQEPFLLLSTGTWSISLNPFNHSPLTASELQADCLSYMQFNGHPVKASRLFAGYEHEQETDRLAEYFHCAKDAYVKLAFNPHLLPTVSDNLEEISFSSRDLGVFDSYEKAYHQLVTDIMYKQKKSTELVINDKVKRIFVDGGFSKNAVFMNLLARTFPETEVYAASIAQASALGAALAIHRHWNNMPPGQDLIGMQYYSVSYKPILS